MQRLLNIVVLCGFLTTAAMAAVNLDGVWYRAAGYYGGVQVQQLEYIAVDACDYVAPHVPCIGSGYSARWVPSELTLEGLIESGADLRLIFE